MVDMVKVVADVETFERYVYPDLWHRALIWEFSVGLSYDRARLVGRWAGWERGGGAFRVGVTGARGILVGGGFTSGLAGDRAAWRDTRYSKEWSA